MASVVKLASTCRRALVPIAERSAGANAWAAASAPASAPGSFAGTSHPVISLCATVGCAMTVSGGAPILVAITGQATAAASIAVLPKASGSMEATTVTCEASVGRRNVLHMPDHADVLRQPQALDLCLQLLDVSFTPLSVAGQDRDRALQNPAVLEQGQRIDQHALSLPAGQSRSLQDHTLFRRQTPAAPQLRHAIRRDGLRIERSRIDAAMNDFQTFARRAVARRNQVGGIAGIGDHHVAPGHHAIVELLQRVGSL